jgi:hypothetical protein
MNRIVPDRVGLEGRDFLVRQQTQTVNAMRALVLPPFRRTLRRLRFELR